VTDPTADRAVPGSAAGPDSIVGWLLSGTLDSQLAACVWLLAEGGVPVLVADDDASVGQRLARALDAFGRPPTFLAAFPTRLEAASLEGVLEALAAPPHDLTEDAIRSVGVVVIVRSVPGIGPRVTAAHYVRPLEQDPHGHVQRRPPALLAAWDPEADRFDDYAWGISAELAGRVGREPAAFERTRAERAVLLGDLAARRVVAREAVAQAILAAGQAPERTH
jgi:hypothetical protein